MLTDFTSINAYVFAIVANIALYAIFLKLKKRLILFFRAIGYLLISLPFALLLGFRDVSVGHDTINYVYHLKLFPNYNYGEPIYKLFLYINSLLGKDRYYILLSLYSILTIVAITIAADMLEDRISSLTFLTCFYMFFGLNMTDQIRQIAALAVLAVGVAAYYRGKKKTSIALCMFSIIIHMTAIFAIGLFWVSILFTSSKVVYFKINNLRFSVNTKIVGGIVLLTVAILFFYRMIFAFLSSFVGRYGVYFSDKVNVQKIGWGWILDIMPIIFIAMYRRKQGSKFDKCLYAYSLFTIPLRFLGYFSQFLSRMDYFTITAALILGAQKNVVKKRYGMLIAISVIYFIIFYLIQDFHGSFPYKRNPLLEH